MSNATAELGAGVPPAEDMRRGVAALVRELGAAGAARFLARLGEQGGDYTAERRVFAGLSVAEIVAEIEGERAKPGAAADGGP